MTSSFDVPVIDVHNGNFKELWPAMVVALKTSSFVAVDTELSGLGNRASLLAASIEDRYKAICHAARSRSILSLGIACFKKLSNKAADTYLVQVYNLTLLCSEEYIIEPQSVQFLVQHGFDFNKQYAEGIPYHKGNNKGGSDNQGVHIRALFTELLRAKKPLVLHNGLIDIAFLYQNFYAHLPDHLATFTADLSEMFPAGLFDTKYVTEFDLRFSASYLEYAYKKCKLDNSRNESSVENGRRVYLEFCQYAGAMSSYVDYRSCPTGAPHSVQADICQSFSAFGWCSKGTKCPFSHDTDLIILQDDKSKDDKRKKRKRQKKKKREGELDDDSSVSEGAPQNKIPHLEMNPDESHQVVTEGCLESADLEDGNTNTELHEGENLKRDSNDDRICEDKLQSTNTEMTTGTSENKAESGTHRAGFDAFMTGYIFAYSCTLVKKEEEDASEEKLIWPLTSFNKVYLSGKTTPLNIVKSTFSKSSKAHVQKMEMVWGGKQ
ncbi:target of EGR1 protein 1 [Corythoichthys intestinalis]|uniref:target of EGR1 protein 1 n=1 Tax=Corythoichthys intestinalis TaxID=161448 RepID=UPI0025A57F2B|nr:target of EGR1 protein 1 [Corythoichthys intestinalis]XP_061795411.1 target of EGR1 protein 1 [Nerophis lumbriciformis]